MKGIMKHYIVNILVAAALTLCSLASCVKENISAPDHGEGTVYLSLNVLSGGMDQVIVKSPWDPNDANERAVENLRIYIFSKATGNLVGYKYFSKDDLTFTDDSSQPGYDRTAIVSNIPTSTGEVYIYAIANARTSQYKVTDDAILDIDESNLSHLTRETFLSATCTRQLGSINPADNRFVMSGFVNDGKHVTIARKAGTTEAEITDPTDDDHKRVKLYKILSKNKITVKSEGGVTFKPEYMEIHNVPQVYGLMRGNNVSPSGFETFDRIIWSENSYQCYLPANVQTATASPASFNDREKNTYDDTGKKTFVNAPANATYVVIHGKYQGGDYAGDLSYTVHLGNFSKHPADFSVAANSNYEYTLTIKGVNNFIAESQKNGDDPGSEGVVIFKGTDILEVDCHYEARVMKFSMSELNDIINVGKYGYILKIQTAFCETISMIVDGEGRIYDAAEFKTQSNPTVLTTVGTDGMPVDASRILISGDVDFDWVRFVKNTGVYSSTPKSSPGCMVSSSHAISDVCAYPGRANTQTIFEFLRDLYKAGKEQTASYFNATGSSVYVTCFVDENYYPDKNWTEYVNKSEPRRMYFANELFVSADGQSSFARAKYVVSQKSIWTFYKLDPTLKPFGLEFVSEEKAQGKNVANGTNSRQEYWNGRASAIRNNSGNKFYDNSTKSANGTQDLYLSAYRACMSRNRDESGDGKIGADEIKWYLASVDQYKGIWAGEEALNTDMRLFKASASEWVALNDAFTNNGGDAALSPWHYFACSPADTFWAEEGCATGTNGSATMVRCIRTLESKANGLGEADKYYEYDPATETVTMLLNSDALRSAQLGGFQTYFERGKDSNKLYKKFKIASANLSGTYKRNQVISTAKGSGFINASDDVCQKAAEYGGAWRVPNQRELSIMSAVDNETFINLFSCTSFTGVQSGYYKGGTGNEYGFVLAGAQMTVAVGANASYGVRCVMDVVD